MAAGSATATAGLATAGGSLVALGATTAVVPPVGLTLIAVGAGICVAGYLVRHPEWCRAALRVGSRRSTSPGACRPRRCAWPSAAGGPALDRAVDPDALVAARSGSMGHSYDQTRMPTLARSETLDAQLKALPDSPGVYLFHDRDGMVLYVGKAKSLRKRVQSYFRREAYATLKTAELVDRIDEIEFLGTGSEHEALLLEQNMIKRHRPPFNIRLRDDKSYPYIAVTAGDEYPRVMFTRERHRKGVLYFGPYSSAKKVRETLDVLNRVFPYRPCEGPTPGRRSGVPCLDHHIGRCAAPCVGLISQEDYAAVIDGVVEFLSGRVRPLERRLEQQMKDAAARHEFEEAARYRNRLTAVRHLAERQVADHVGSQTGDVLAAAVSERHANVQLFQLRDGRLADRRSFYLDNAGGESESEVLWGFALEYYGGQVAIPPSVIVPSGFEDADLLAMFLARAARQRGRGAGRTARREAAAGGAGRRQRRDRARARPAGRASARAPAGWRRSRSCASS